MGRKQQAKDGNHDGENLHLLKELWRRCNWRNTFTFLWRVGCYIFTFAFYILELVLLLRVIDILFGNVGLRPFQWLSNWEPVKFLIDLPLMTALKKCWLVQTAMTIFQEAVTISDWDKLINAVGAVIGAIGVGGVAITWLINAAERLVCGVRTGELLGWVHRLFFTTYAVIFMPTVLLGIFASNANRWEAALYSLVGVAFGLAFIMIVLFAFVLIVRVREWLAFRYYARFAKTNSWIWICNFVNWIRRKPYQPYCPERVRRTMLSVADYFKEQYTGYHRNISRKMARLWINSCWIPFGETTEVPIAVQNRQAAHRKPQYRYPAEYLSNEKDYIVVQTILSRDIWAELFPNELLSEESIGMIRKILYSLYETAKDRRYFAALLGFLLCLEDKNCDEETMIKTIGKITLKDDGLGIKYHNVGKEGGLPQEVRSDLIWGLLMVMAVGWLQKAPYADYTAQTEFFCKMFRMELNESCARPEGTENALLWYAEWAARWRRKFPLNQYLLRLSAKFEEKNSFAHLDLTAFGFRKSFLISLLGDTYVDGYSLNESGHRPDTGEHTARTEADVNEQREINSETDG